MIIARLLKHGNSYGVVIPRPLLAQLRWVAGDLVTLEVSDGVLSARPLSQTIARVERRRGRGPKATAGAGT